jgi:hypothetical protein
MLILDEHDEPIIIESIHGPTPTEYFWVLDLNQEDFTLAPLVMLEEIICPTMQIQINGFTFNVPAGWNVLVYDSDTTQLDVVELSETAGREFTALVYGPNKSYPTPGKIIVTNYFVEHKNVSPSLNKHQMLCHPISSDEWINLSPSDSFNKYLKNKTVGDLVGP